jgi:uncharacterized protein YigE (DUF2233 family)
MANAHRSISWLALLALFFGVGGSDVRAAQGARLAFLGKEFVVYRVEPATDDLSLYWRDSSGKPFATFSRLRADLAARSKELKFAINAGIYSVDLTPLGLHIERSKVLHPLNLGDIEGGQFNFYLKPNGVFYVEGTKPAILESSQYAKLQVSPRLACQSGPLLVFDGKYHPAFRPDSTNYRTRNGVGVTTNGQVVFAISETALRFYDFARLFREQLGCDNALYLDGEICAVYAPEVGLKSDNSFQFAAMFAVTTPLGKPRRGAGRSP